MGYHIDKVDDFITIPNALKVYVYDRTWLNDFALPKKDNKGMTSWWLLDGASVIPVLALDLKPSDHVMDMCAAPGGKSLMILQTGSLG